MSFKQIPNKTLACDKCGDLVKNVGHDASGVICWRCVARSLSGQLEPESDDTGLATKPDENSEK
jgi:hypothetical protein